MLVVRLPGRRTVRQALAELAPAKTPDPSLPQVAQVEVVLESDARGGLHVHSPNFGVPFTARSSLVSWGVLKTAEQGTSGWDVAALDTRSWCGLPLDVQRLPLRLTTTLHTTIIPTSTPQPAERHMHCSAVF